MSGRVHSVLDTRPHASAAFADILRAAGIAVLHIPLIRIEAAGMTPEAARALDRIDDFDGILLTSMNAVRHFATLLRARGIDPATLPPVHVVGAKTAGIALREGFRPGGLPSAYYGATLAAELPDVEGRLFLQPCADIAREEVAEGIRTRGGEIEQLVVYRTLGPATDDAQRLREAAGEGAYDCAAFFSPSAVRHYAALLGETERPSAAVAVIGDTTAAEAEARGLRVDIIPPEQTAEALAQAITEWNKNISAP